MISLRDYQQRAIDDIREHFRSGARSVLYQCGTGSGKSLVMAFMAKAAAEKGLRVCFIVHRDYLISQLSEILSQINLPHGKISPLYTPSQHSVQIASTFTLIRRLDRYAPFDLLIYDEAHRTVGATNLAIAKHYSKARIVGLTASPIRLDGRPLGDVYERLVIGPSIQELTERGFLAPFVYYAPTQLDMTGVKIRAGDFDRGEVEKRVNKPFITGSAIEYYMKLCAGKRAIVFAASINHSRQVVAEFRAAGIPALHIDGETPHDVRSEFIAAFDSGRVKVLSNVDLISEGFDICSVEAVILLRPTNSLTQYLQSVGRALRPSPGKTQAVILDHVSNYTRHSLPDEPREWSLNAERKSRRVSQNDAERVDVRQCPKCYGVFVDGSKCPHCGHEIPIKVRKLEQREGELKAISREEARRARLDLRRRQGQAKTLDDLRAFARETGRSEAWAYHVHHSRMRKRGVR